MTEARPRQEDAPFLGIRQNKEGAADFFRGLHEAHEIHLFEPQRYVAAEDKVFVWARSAGTEAGIAALPAFGLPVGGLLRAPAARASVGLSQRARSRPDFPGRLSPSFRIRLRSVLGLMPKSLAAPRSPSIIQLVVASTASMWRRPASCSEPRVSVRADTPLASSPIFESRPVTSLPADGEAGARNSSARTNVLPGDRITARSITFCNSRMLPGQG